MASKEVEEYWARLGDVPVDDEGRLEEPYEVTGPLVHRTFPPGTDREDIWHWFEEVFDVSVAELMYGRPHLEQFYSGLLHREADPTRDPKHPHRNEEAWLTVVVMADSWFEAERKVKAYLGRGDAGYTWADQGYVVHDVSWFDRELLLKGEVVFLSGT